MKNNTEIKTGLWRWGGWRDLGLRRCIWDGWMDLGLRRCVQNGCRYLRTSYNPRGCCTPTTAPTCTCAWACYSRPTTASSGACTWTCSSMPTTSNVLTSAALVLRVAVAVDSMSCLLFACPSAAGPPPSLATLFRTCQTWLCARLPTGSISNSAKWLSIWNRERTSTIRF